MPAREVGSGSGLQTSETRWASTQGGLWIRAAGLRNEVGSRARGAPNTRNVMLSVDVLGSPLSWVASCSVRMDDTNDRSNKLDSRYEVPFCHGGPKGRRAKGTKYVSCIISVY